MTKLTSLEKALKLLDAVAKAKKIGLRDLAAQLGFPPSTVHRLLGVLTTSRYLKQDSETKKYQLSLKFLEMGAAVRENLDVVTVARPHMASLSNATSETVNLAFFEGIEIVYVDQIANSDSLLRMFTRVGTRAPLYCTGVGKAYLGNQSKDFISDYWRETAKKQFTVNTIIREEDLDQDLESVRRLGYAVDNEEMEIGVRCVAAPIRQHVGNVVAAVSISGPSFRLTSERTPIVGDLVRQTADKISADLGYVNKEIFGI
ncbi:MAG: IclR family transcriptional regulator [Desulfomonilaceae bacterium]